MNHLLTGHLAAQRQADLRAEADRHRIVRAARWVDGEDLTTTTARRLIDAIRTGLGGFGSRLTASHGSA
jgi:hypothetical protein